MSTTRATSKMEELMSALLERMEQQNEQLLGKMEQQNEQLQVMTQQQADRIENVAQRQETDQEVSAIAGELRSVKLMIDDRLDAMEDSVAGLAKQIRATVTEGQELTKHQLREELLQELSDGTSALRPTAQPSGTTAAVAGEVTDRSRDAIALHAAHQQRLANLTCSRLAQFMAAATA